MMLITLPDSDSLTQHLSVWNEEVIDVAEKNGIQPIVSRGKNANISFITKNIESKNPKLLIFNGHGGTDCIYGQNNEILVQLGKNDNLLKSRIVHSFTCNSARELGRNSEAEAFIGYDNEFWLCRDRFSLTRPLSDKFASPIMKSAMNAPIQLAKKKTAKEAFDKSQEEYEKWLDEFSVSSSKHTSEELQLILPILLWNKNSQKLYGSPDARY